MQGVEFKETARLDLPATDAANPEINRLWALRRVNSLQKEADRRGDRSLVIPEIVRLGEDFSIATEYTSFIVLENDAEYQRWKIARRNLAIMSDDRQAQAARRTQLEAIRNRALSEIGPQAVALPARPAGPMQVATAPQAISPAVTPTTTPPPAQSAPPPSETRRERSRSFDLRGGGSSPVGPIGVLLSAWFLRRKQKATAA